MAVSKQPLMPVRVFIPWPQEQGPPEGWPTNYVDHADFCKLERAARKVVEKQDAFLAAPEGAPTLYRSHMLSLAIEELGKVLDA